MTVVRTLETCGLPRALLCAATGIAATPFSSDKSASRRSARIRYDCRRACGKIQCYVCLEFVALCDSLIQERILQDAAQHEASRRSDCPHLIPNKHNSEEAAAWAGADESPVLDSYMRAQENWETLTADMVQRWSANGGKGRKITVNVSGMVCTSYEGYLRRFPGTLLSEMVRDPRGELHKKRCENNAMVAWMHQYTCVARFDC